MTKLEAGKNRAGKAGSTVPEKDFCHDGLVNKGAFVANRAAEKTKAEWRIKYAIQRKGGDTGIVAPADFRACCCSVGDSDAGSSYDSDIG